MKGYKIYLVSYFIPGLGQLIQKKYTKGCIILALWIVSPVIILNSALVKIIPQTISHFLLLVWSTSLTYENFKIKNGIKYAQKHLLISLLIIFVGIPCVFFTLKAGLKYFQNEYLNEKRTKTEMKAIKIELDNFKKHYGYYPKDYHHFISVKPLRSFWKKDNWKTDYRYKAIDSLNFELISAGKDLLFDTEDDIKITNK